MANAHAGISRKKIIILFAGMFVVPAALLGGYYALKERAKSEVSGSIRLADKREFTAVRCGSGLLSEDAPRSSAQFHGVDIFSASSPELRIRGYEDTEKGMVVTLRYDNGAPITIDRSACKKFNVKLEETGEMILDHWGLEGELHLDCPELVADLRFTSCYSGS